MRIETRIARSRRWSRRAALLIAALCSLPLLAQPAASPEATPAATAAPEPAGPGRVGHAKAAIIPVHGEISDVTTQSLRRRIEEARAAGATLVVFELNTPGGLAASGLDIADLFKNTEDLYTVAWVNTQAYSAGSLIAVACDEIVMTPGSHLGDCGVILGGPTGPEAVPEELRAKAESPILEQFRDSAARHGYDPLLAEGFVLKELVIYWIEHIATGERRFVLEKDKERLVAPGKDAIPASPADPDAAEPIYEWKLVESYRDPITGRDVPVSQPIKPSTELLTLSQSRAYAFGFCRDIVRNVDEIREVYGVSGEVIRLESTWSERFTGWLTSMPVRMFLLVIILLGAYVEFNTPGVGVPGLVALIALAIFVGAPYLSGLANVWEIVLIVLGVILLAVEIFVLPGFGISGILGILCLLVGLLSTFIPEDPTQPFPIYWPRVEQAVDGLKMGIVTLAVGVVGSGIAMVIFSRLAPRAKWLHAMIPPNPEPVVVTPDDPYQGYARVGDIGIVETLLRPAGKARFGPQLVDVVSEGEFIEPPADVEVIERRGNRVVVRRVRPR
jgi:membrane-bound serine protease (ClpP class)